MPARKPPTLEEIDTALAELPGDPLDNGNAVSWGIAVKRVEFGLHTTTNRAGHWLFDAATTPKARLAVIRCQYLAEIFTSPREVRSLRSLGWSEPAVRHLAFTAAGHRVSVADIQAKHRTNLRWLIRRDVLREMLASIEQELVQQAEDLAAHRATEYEKFRALHGAALDVIQEALSTVHPRDREDFLTTSTHDGSRLFGSPGNLTIHLWGDQIEAFARVLAQREVSSPDS